MNIDRVIVGELQTNCYILSINNECIVIDPGDEYSKIKNNIGDKNVVGVIITHYHFDHIGTLNNFDKQLILDKSNLEEREYNIGNFNFKVIYTPGHKEDLITIYFEKEKIMFTGDFIFESSIGRMDLPGGNINDMKRSLEKIKKYDDNIKIYPGHGNSTVLGKEKYNFEYFL